MARLPRYVIPGQPQHIIQRGNNRQVIFAADADDPFFRGALVAAAKSHGLAIHGYVWMTHPIHLLATPAFDYSISKVFQSVGRRYVQYFHFTYRRSGTLWEGRYRATVVDSEPYLLTLMRDIELNPVRAGMVAPQGLPGIARQDQEPTSGGMVAPQGLPLVELSPSCARRVRIER